MPITPSVFQQGIFNFITHQRGSAVVIAVAGSGKTTTIVEAAKLIPPGAAATFVAFNKAIAMELGTKLPKTVRAQTLNAAGFGAWIRVCSGGLVVDSLKTRKLMDEIVPENEQKLYTSLPRLVSLAKSVGIVPAGATVPTSNGLTEETEYNWMELINYYDLDSDGDNLRMIDYARAILRRSIDMANKVVDFDDQMYMPVIARTRFFQNDFLFVDEAQDVNLIQRRMLRMMLKPSGRLIAVGDPCQAIYGFRGADSNAIENIKSEFSAVELPLSISYRCPVTVVKEAQRYVNHIQAAPAAAEGEVHQYIEGFDHTHFKANDIVVCRCTAPLIAVAYKLIRKRVPCFVMGREIGQGLVAIIDKMKAKGIDSLVVKLREYQSREYAKLIAAKQEAKAEALNDKLETISLFIEELSENDRTVPALRNSISALFSDNMQAQAVKLMTMHKSKGLEADRVFILNFELNEKFMARPSNQQQQEVNLAYVAITRAKKYLAYIHIDQLR